MEEREACLTIKRPEIMMTGKKWQYRAMHGKDYIEFRTYEDGVWIGVKLSDIEQIIKELQAIVRNADKITGGNGLEVW